MVQEVLGRHLEVREGLEADGLELEVVEKHLGRWSPAHAASITLGIANSIGRVVVVITVSQSDETTGHHHSQMSLQIFIVNVRTISLWFPLYLQVDVLRAHVVLRSQGRPTAEAAPGKGMGAPGYI